MRSRCVLALCAPVLIAAVGCRPNAASSPSKAQGAPASGARFPASAEASVAEMRRLHTTRDYAALGEFVAEAHRTSFIDTLAAMDDFQAANSAVLASIRDDVGEGLLPEWDLSQWADAMGLFAPDVRVVSVEGDGKTVTVHYQIGRRLPLKSETLEWELDRWVYDPGPSSPDLNVAIRELASALNGVARKAQRKPMSPESLDMEFRLRIVPRLNKLVRVAQSLPPPRSEEPTIAADAEMPPSNDDDNNALKPLADDTPTD